MRSKNRYPGMDPAIVKQIQYHAWRLKQMPCFCSEDIEDIEQELLCEVLKCLAKYNKQKSSLGTFVDQIITRRSNNMIRRRLSLKRGSKSTTISLDVCDEYGVALVDKLPDEQSFEDLNLVLDVAHIVCRLPEGTQRITTLLQTLHHYRSCQHDGQIACCHLQAARANSSLFYRAFTLPQPRWTSKA